VIARTTAKINLVLSPRMVGGPLRCTATNSIQRNDGVGSLNELRSLARGVSMRHFWCNVVQQPVNFREPVRICAMARASERSAALPRYERLPNSRPIKASKRNRGDQHIQGPATRFCTCSAGMFRTNRSRCASGSDLASGSQLGAACPDSICLLLLLWIRGDERPTVQPIMELLVHLGT